MKTGIPILLRWYALWKATPGSHSAEVEDFCRPLFWDKLSFGDVPDYSIPELMDRILAAIATLAEEFCPDEKIDPHLLEMKNKYTIEIWRARSWISRATQQSRHRRFFISNSKLVGLCPASAEQGDMICLFLGCSVPVILRPREGHYILHGAAFVSEYMYGKGMEEFVEGKHQLQDFEIH